MKAIRRLFGIADEGADLISADIRAAWKGFRAVDEGVRPRPGRTIASQGWHSPDRRRGGGRRGRLRRPGTRWPPPTAAGHARAVSPSQRRRRRHRRTQSSAPAYSVASPTVTLADLPVHALLKKHARTCTDESGAKLAALREAARFPRIWPAGWRKARCS